MHKLNFGFYFHDILVQKRIMNTIPKEVENRICSSFLRMYNSPKYLKTMSNIQIMKCLGSCNLLSVKLWLAELRKSSFHKNTKWPPEVLPYFFY